MMLSVLRHTKTPVKFWFLKNYLSPSFKVHISSPDFVFAQMNLLPGANPYPVSVYTTLQKMFSPPVILGVFRTPSPTWPRRTTSSTSWCSTSGPVGSTSRRRSSESSGDTKSSSWMFCSLWPWIRSSLWTPTKWVQTALTNLSRRVCEEFSLVASLQTDWDINWWWKQNVAQTTVHLIWLPG